MTASVKNFDWRVLRWISKHMKCKFLDFLMPKVTFLGDFGIFWIVVAVVLMFWDQYRYFGALLLVGMIIGVVVGNIIIKNMVGRARPCWEDENIELLIRNPKDYSLPSGHTLSSVISATILTMANPHFGWVAIPIAVLIAFSRLYLCVHYPSDVFVAVAMGIMIGCLTYFILGTMIMVLLGRTGLLPDPEIDWDALKEIEVK